MSVSIDHEIEMPWDDGTALLEVRAEVDVIPGEVGCHTKPNDDPGWPSSPTELDDVTVIVTGAWIGSDAPKSELIGLPEIQRRLDAWLQGTPEGRAEWKSITNRLWEEDDESEEPYDD